MVHNLIAFIAFWSIVSPSVSFNLTILHTNDVHCRFEQANKYGGTCTDNDAAQGKCFGGYARMVHLSREIRNREPNSIFIHGGDYFQGTIWYTIHKWRVVSHFVNRLNLTAMVSRQFLLAYFRLACLLFIGTWAAKERSFDYSFCLIYKIWIDVCNTWPFSVCSGNISSLPIWNRSIKCLLNRKAREWWN